MHTDLKDISCDDAAGTMQSPLMSLELAGIVESVQGNFIEIGEDSGRRKIGTHPPRVLSTAIVSAVRAAGCLANGATSCAAITRQGDAGGPTVDRHQARQNWLSALWPALTTREKITNPCAACRVKCRVTVETLANLIAGEQTFLSHKEISRALHGRQALSYSKLAVLIKAAGRLKWLDESEESVLVVIVSATEGVARVAKNKHKEAKGFLRKGPAGVAEYNQALSQIKVENLDAIANHVLRQTGKHIKDPRFGLANVLVSPKPIT